VTTVGDGFVLAVVELETVVNVEAALGALEEMVEMVDVVDVVVGTGVELGVVLSTTTLDETGVVLGSAVEVEAVLSTTMIDGSVVVLGSAVKLEGLVSLVERPGDVNDGNGTSLFASEGVDEGSVAETVDSVVELAVDVTLPSDVNGDPVPFQ